jgi:hypothetical protein
MKESSVSLTPACQLNRDALERRSARPTVIRTVETHAACPGAGGSTAAHEDGMSLPKQPETALVAMSAGGG